jgi:recombination protein RecA
MQLRDALPPIYKTINNTKETQESNMPASNSKSPSDAKLAALEVALAQIDKQFGKGSAMRMGEQPKSTLEVIPTSSTALDIALGIGGYPRGRIVEIYGPESSGKTTLALHAVANVQKAGGVVAYIDAEHALDPLYATNVGIDLNSLIISQPDTGEQGLEIADTLIRSGAVDLIVIDSVAALVPRAEIEGEMGQSHVGLQARMMSQALRKITGALHQTGTTAIFINQLREKIGVMFGCFHYDTRVMLADGTSEKIGKIVNQRMEVEVLSFNSETGKIEPRKIMNWFNNGKADQFLQFKVSNWQGSGSSKFAATENHLIATPNGYESAGDLKVGDSVNISTKSYLTADQIDLIKGGLLGDGSLRKLSSRGVTYRMGHGEKQVGYLDWKTSKFENINKTTRLNDKGAKFVDLYTTSELYDLWSSVYDPKGGKRNVKSFNKEYFSSLSPKAWAIYLMDDGHFDFRTEGKQHRTAGGSGRIQFCLDAMTKDSQQALHSFFTEAMGVESSLRTSKAGTTTLSLSVAGTRAFMEHVAGYVHPSMEYKMLPQFRNFTDYATESKVPENVLNVGIVKDIYVKPQTKTMSKYDIEVEGNHNYFVDGVIVHNSPETTTGGKALKFYASVRLDIRRIETIKDGTDAIANRTRVKVVKNKVATPFKQAEFDIVFGEGISFEGGLIDLGVQFNIVKKAGAWFTYGTTQLGQGKEKARQFLKADPAMAREIELKIQSAAGLNPDQIVIGADPVAAVDSVEDSVK